MMLLVVETTESSEAVGWRSSAPERVRRWWNAVEKVLNSPTILFLVALLARLKALHQLLSIQAGSVFPYDEELHIGWALASGLGFSAPWPHTVIAPTAQQPPIYPFLVAGVFKLAGAYSNPSVWLLLSLNAIISAFTAVLILRIGRRDFGRKTGALAAWVFACWVYEVTVSIRLWESTLAALLLMLGILLFPKMEYSRNIRPWLLFGTLTGVAGLTNTTLLAVLPPFWLCLWMMYRKRRESCSKALLISVTACVLVLVPWTMRNYQVFHRLIPIRDNFGLELWVGIELDSTPKPAVKRPFPLDFPLSNPSVYNRLGESAFMESRTRLAMEFIHENPLEYLRVVSVRCVRFWSQPENMLWPVISVLAWIGAFLALTKKRASALPYFIVLFAFPLVYYITHTFPTYRQPIEPVMLLLAAYAVTSAGHVVTTISRKYCSL
jgi:4-amino-4-deoxy-L-arabinose transferase-like glycosyltransferase